MIVIGREIPKLPLTFAGIGAAYYLMTLAQKPQRFADHATSFDLHTTAEWERHMRDAKFALLAGLGAGAVLWGLESWR